MTIWRKVDGIWFLIGVPSPYVYAKVYRLRGKWVAVTSTSERVHASVLEAMKWCEKEIASERR